MIDVSSHKTPFTWKCGTIAELGDIAEYGKYRGILYWSEYLKSYEVSVGTGLTLNENSIDDFTFIARGEINNNPYA